MTRILFTTLAALAFTSPAYALSCVFGIEAVNVVDQQDVPTNVKIVVTHTFDADNTLSMELTAADGTVIEVSREDHDRYLELIPAAPLAPDADYKITTVEFGEYSFHTGAGPDTEAPEAPSIEEFRRVSSHSQWGESKGISVQLSPPTEVGGNYEFQLSTRMQFDDVIGTTTAYPSVYLGQGVCGNTLPEYDHSKRYFIRARVIDMAGNVSEWTNTSQPARGCSTAGGSGSLATLGLVLMGLGLGRRRSNRGA